MNKQSYKILVWLVVALLILNLSALGAMLWFRNSPPPPPKKPYSMNQDKPGMRFHDTYISEEVGFNDQQLEQFKELRNYHLEDIKRISDEIEKTKQLQFKAVRQDNTDATLLDSLNKRMGELHYLWSRSSGDFLLKVKSICTEEQRDKMFTMLERSRKHQLCGRDKSPQKFKGRRD